METAVFVEHLVLGAMNAAALVAAAYVGARKWNGHKNNRDKKDSGD